MSELWQFAVIGLSAGGAYALVALGIVAVYRGSGILNFAQGAIGMIAGYAFWSGSIVPARELRCWCPTR